ncbi:MAG: DUF134 domain-containing protein [Candidatus Pacearchaeota archaeon]|nr:MAG: DUF134 domain-containing protein [Candidatus Pacearchaeota archaeon]
MPRLRRRRRIGFMPGISHFAPVGGPTLPEEIILTLDEFEAIRLKDLKAMEQEKAAEQMGISQPTFHRLILAARKKVADALVNNKIIKIQGGRYEMITPVTSPIVGPGRGRGFGRGMGRGRGRGFGRGAGPAGFCICPKCGNKETKVPGIPCNQMMCKKCSSLMVRGD